MIDVHDTLAGPGVMPEILGFPTYSLCVGAGLAAGLLYLLWARRTLHRPGEPGDQAIPLDGSQLSSAKPVDPALIIVVSALVAGTIGSKIPTLLTNPTLVALLTEKSVVGGLLGGMAGVLVVKRLLKIRMRLGNAIAPAAALGLAIGRLGCFFNGCCVGIPASWGVDFGDGLLRLPTQLFEVAFQLSAFTVLHLARTRVRTPGILFKLYVIAYFLFRFFVEFIRVNPIVWNGLTLYQLLCLAGIIWMVFLMSRTQRVHAREELEAPHER